MNYNKQNFIKGQILKADHLNAMEDGIMGNSIEISSLKDDMDAVNRDVNGYLADTPVQCYRILFDSVWNAKKDQQSASASAAEVRFYDTDGVECAAASVQADSEYSSTYQAGNVLDGNPDTFWSSADAEGVIHTLTFTLAGRRLPRKSASFCERIWRMG